eukprot:5738410-Prorocentrum_lima.AAC.1
MEIDTLCTESSMDPRCDCPRRGVGQIPTWKEHHCRWSDTSASEGKVERSQRQIAAARCDQ